MKAMSRNLMLALIATTLGACASVKKAELPSTAVPADEISRLESDIQSGYTAQYDILAPKEFAKSQSYLAEAKSDLSRGKKQETVLDDVAYGRAYLEKTKQVAETRLPNTQRLLEARMSALEAGARNHPAERKQLGKLDDDFRDLATDSTITTKEFDKMQTAYLDLEMKSIQARALDQTNAKISGAVRDGAEKITPRALKQARLDQTAALNLIAANRHNPEGYKAAVEKADKSSQFLVEVLAAAKRGNEVVSENVATDFVLSARNTAALKGELEQTEEQKAALSQQLGQQQSALTEAQAAAAMDAAMEQARKEFKSNEAEVYRQGDRLLIRLKAMMFPVGKADLPKHSLDLLSKVKGIAEDLHPRQVVVEGHTDTTGSAAVNQKLSTERAQAVAQYLEQNGIEGDKIQSIGEGYQRPIAPNKTAKDRAKNRRVDVIITPNVQKVEQDSKQM